jgi:parallel beta-helix repeat protein
MPATVMEIRFKLAILLGAFLASCPGALATTFYVAPAPVGQNSADGLTEATALDTPQAAINKAFSGDTILLRGGNYPVGVGAMSFDSARHRGSDTSWLTIKNYPGEQPVFKWSRATANYCAIWLTDAAYVEISGLTLVGWNDEITLSEAQADTTASLIFNAVGIQADGRDGTVTRDSTNRPHHFHIIGNTIRNFSGGGISFIQSDYLELSGNTVEDCSWYSIWAGSGISIWQAWNFDSTNADYRIRVTGNRLYGNKALVIWQSRGYLSDGNGLIIDDFRNTQNSSPRGAYSGRTLVANNLAVNNGGSGIHTYESDNVDVVHNTAYFNGQVLDYGEIFALDSGNIRIVNNICVARPDRAINKQSSASANVDYRGNLYLGGYANGAYYSANNTFADPAFLNPALDLATSNFRPGPASPAIDTGLTTLSGVSYPWVAQLTTDITDGSRNRASGPDLGAYEREGVPVPTTGLVVTGLGEPILSGDTTTSSGNDTAFASTEINLPAASAPAHTFKLVNHDSAALSVSSLSISGSDAFTIMDAPALPLVLNPGASTTFRVRFSPATVGTHAATVSLSHTSPATASPFIFVLSGVGVQRSYALVSASSLEATLPASSTATHSGLVLTNIGSAPLTWNADLPKTYTVATSLSPSGPAYQWVDISTTGTAVSFNNLNNSFSTALNLGFSFPFFGSAYSQICVNTNGHLSFDTSKAGNTQSRYRTPSALVTMKSGDNALLPKSIAALFDDLLLISGTSQVRYQQTDADTFVLSWLNVTYNSDANLAAASRRMLTFQLILKRDGTITAQYQGIANTDGNYLIGIVNTLVSSGTNNSNQFFQYAYTANAVNASFALRYTPPPRALDGTTNFAPGFPNAWADFSGMTSGMIAPGASQTLPVTFKSNNLVSGLTYRSTLTITTNDADRSTVYLPLALTVGANANLSPAVTLSTPQRSVTLQGIGTPLILTADATDPDGTVAQVQFFDGPTLLATATTAPYSFSWVSTTAAAHTISARVTDNLGATVTSQSITVTVVNLPPSVSITSPTVGATFIANATTTFAAAAVDPDGTISKVEFYAGGILRGTDTTAPYECSWTPTTYGPVAVYAKAFDVSGGVTISDLVNVAVLRPTVPADSLVAYWRFNEGTGFTAADLSGQARTASLGNATWNSSGKFGAAVNFDNTAYTKATFDHPALGAFSFSAWVNGTAAAGIQFPVILSLPGTGNNGANGYTLQFRRLNTTDTLLRGISFNDGTGGDWQSWSTLTNDTWYHLVVTFDGAASSTSGVKIYFNGVIRNDTTNYGNFNGQLPGTIATTDILKGNLGNRSDQTSPFAGSLDQVRIYSRVLTPEEVSALYLDDGGPSAATNLAAAAMASGIQLTWNPVTANYPAATYNLARATSPSGPFSPVAGSIASPNWIDNSTAAGATYYYTLNATVAGDTGATAGPVSATAWTAQKLWRNQKFGTPEDTGIAADLEDPDFDGVPNLLEYAFGGSPLDSSSAPRPSATYADSQLKISFLRAAQELTYTVEGTSILDGASWLPVPFQLGSVGEISTATDNSPNDSQRFLRLRVTAP